MKTGRSGLWWRANVRAWTVTAQLHVRTWHRQGAKEPGDEVVRIGFGDSSGISRDGGCGLTGKYIFNKLIYHLVASTDHELTRQFRRSAGTLFDNPRPESIVAEEGIAGDRAAGDAQSGHEHRADVA
jgi:hypothetical protein